MNESIEQLIYFIRGERVMLDEDLARLYQVETKALVQAVKRNIARLPADFIFQFSYQKVAILRSQIVTSRLHGGRRTLPYVFTEHGVAMLSSVLRSPKAIQINIQIIRAFVRLRQLVASNAKLTEKLAKLEQRYDAQFKSVFDAIRSLMSESEIPKRGRIGFGGDREE